MVAVKMAALNRSLWSRRMSVLGVISESTEPRERSNQFSGVDLGGAGLISTKWLRTLWTLVR
jgi:hypothetical protein